MASKRAPKPAEKPSHPVRLYVISGVFWGVGIGGITSLWVTLIYLLTGPEPFAEKGTTYGATVLIYLAGGLVVGGIFGVLRPWVRGHWSAAAVGFLSGCVVFSMISLATGRFSPLAVVVCAAMLGAPVGWRYWTIFG